MVFDRRIARSLDEIVAMKALNRRLKEKEIVSSCVWNERLFMMTYKQMSQVEVVCLVMTMKLTTVVDVDQKLVTIRRLIVDLSNCNRLK